ncbi:MAG: M20/M25/M40 family metallo-hydrolase [Simkaniaceae bacterium]|nr:M20/M25/M40 family metallo-hydrolase [Simkaniaceae bacterium]
MDGRFAEWFASHKQAIYDDLFTFLRFPSISTDPAHKEDMVACADWLKRYVEAFGFRAELWETSGHPVLYGERVEGDDKPTLLFYLHYDVQPAVPLDEWDSPPFEPVVKEGKVVARGAVDNKGQCFYSLVALRVFHALAVKAGVNCKLCIEGEEEIGSTGLSAILEEKKERLRADYFLVVDFDMHSENQPGITLGMRGMQPLNVYCRNSVADLHSGAFGGVAVNPAFALLRAVGKLRDDDGKVTVPGFYDGVRHFGPDEMGRFDLDRDFREMAKPLSIRALGGEKGYTLLESNWIRPSLEVNGMIAGYTGTGFKTIIPAKAEVKLSVRLVPDQDPDEVVRQLSGFLRAEIPEEMEVRFEAPRGSEGLVTSPGSPFAEVVAQAFEDVFHVPCKRMLCGATVPVIPAMARYSGAQLVMTGTALPEDGMHAPNESFGLGRFEKGFLSIVRVVEILGGK